MDKSVVVLLLLGGGLWLATRGSSSLAGLGDDAAPELELDPAKVPNRRFLARKFYGTFVLAKQSAASLEKASRRMPAPVKVNADAMAANMNATGQRALDAARALDPDFVSTLCRRPNAPSCA